MKKKPLIKTNPYLKDRVKYKEAIITNVRSSSAIEGIRLSETAVAKKTVVRKSHRSKLAKVR